MRWDREVNIHDHDRIEILDQLIIDIKNLEFVFLIRI